MPDNVKALPEIEPVLGVQSLRGLRQVIKKKNRTYRRSLHQAITAVDNHGCQDERAVAAPGWGQWLIRRRPFLSAESV
jgi:hypothetical protein